MKADAMSRDPRRQRYDWHKRDIMPKCVVSLVRLVSQSRRIPLYGTNVGIRYNFGIIVCSPKSCFCAFSLGISFGGKYCFSSIYSLYTISKHDSCVLPFNLIKIVYCQKDLQNVILLKKRICRKEKGKSM